MDTSTRIRRSRVAPSALARPSESGVECLQVRPLILCVEDDDDLREALCDLLASAGYLVLAAGTVAEALELLEDESHICLVLTDHSLPDGTGYSMLATARARGHLDLDTPVVLLTAERPTVLYRVSAVLQKPLCADALLAVIEPLVDAES